VYDVPMTTTTAGTRIGGVLGKAHTRTYAGMPAAEVTELREIGLETAILGLTVPELVEYLAVEHGIRFTRARPARPEALEAMRLVLGLRPEALK
jgi:hypothetical protein